MCIRDSKRPGRTLGASLTLRTGSWNKKNAVGDINIPLAADGRVRSRLVFSGEDSDGFRDHSSIERQGFLASFAMDVTDRTQAVSYTHLDVYKRQPLRPVS